MKCLIGSIAIVVCAVLILLPRIASRPMPSQNNTPPMRIAVPALISSTLPILAKEKGFFQDSELNVQLTLLRYGKDCINKLKQKEYDVAVSYITPIALSLLEGENIKILTEIHSSDHNTAIVYRKDIIQQLPHDFSGKKIGLVKNTNAEFLLSLYLRSHALTQNEVEVVEMEVKEIEHSLLSGEIAAAVLWEPTVSRLITEHKNITTAPTLFYTDFSMVVAYEDYIQKNEERIHQLIRALMLAQDYLSLHPQDSHQTVMAVLDIPDEQYVNKIWPEIKIDVGLTNLLNIMLTEELKWYLRNEKGSVRKHTTSHDDFAEEFLKDLAPEKVTFD